MHGVWDSATVFRATICPCFGILLQRSRKKTIQDDVPGVKTGVIQFNIFPVSLPIGSAFLSRRSAEAGGGGIGL